MRVCFGMNRMVEKIIINIVFYLNFGFYFERGYRNNGIWRIGLYVCLCVFKYLGYLNIVDCIIF